MKKADVLVVIGVGGMGQAIARRQGPGRERHRESGRPRSYRRFAPCPRTGRRRGLQRLPGCPPSTGQKSALLVLADGHSDASLVLVLFFLRDMKGQDGKGRKTRQFP